MQGLKATTLALLAAGALAVSGCNRENPPSTTAQGAPESASPPVPAPTAVPAASTVTTAQGAAPAASAADTSALTLADQNFLTGAATAGLMEVAAARAAAQQASNADVKAFAGRLLKDHTATNADLSALAAKKNLRLPTEVSAGQRPALDALLNARGAEFDRLFVQTIGITAHRSDIALFEQAARDAKDADVRAFAGKALPTLREHLAAAAKLPGANEVGANTPAGSERKTP